jgi:hypothetical protein
MKKVKPVEYVAIKMDITSNIREDIAERFGKIYQVFLFNRNEYTYCCSLSPSYWLETVGFQINEKFEGQFDDEGVFEEVGDLEIEFEHCEHEHGYYYDVYYVERLMKEDPDCFRVMKDWGESAPYQYETMNDAVEDYRANPEF